MSIQVSTSFFERRHASTHHAVLASIPERRFLAIDGLGDPRAADFRLAATMLQQAVHSLFASLRRGRIPEPSRPGVLESCWWPSRIIPVDEVAAAFSDRSTWHWRQLIELPAAAPDAIVDAAVDEARRRAGREAALVRQWTFTEGPVAQLLHIGGHEQEPASVARLMSEINEAGVVREGPLHILQLTDPDRVPVGRRRAIIRQPFV